MDSQESIRENVKGQRKENRHRMDQAHIINFLNLFLVFHSSILILPDAGKDRGKKEKRASEDEMVGWHHWCNGHELGQTSEDGEGQGGLVFCSSLGHKDMTGWLENNNILIMEFLPRQHLWVCFFPFFDLLSHFHRQRVSPKMSFLTSLHEFLAWKLTLLPTSTIPNKLSM